MYDELRRAILERISQEVQRKSNRTQIPRGIDNLLPGRQFSPQEKDCLESLTLQIYYDLSLERVLVPGTGSLSSLQCYQWPFYQVTDYGKRALQEREYSPYDPSGYISRLKSELPDIDETIIRYVEESLRCLQAGCLLGAAVMIGGASEMAIILLIEQFGTAITDPQKKQDYESKTSTWIITKKYKAFRDSLDRVSGGLPKEMRDMLGQLPGAFDLIRRIRNEAGHPTGTPITRDAIHASHILFPGYCKYVYTLLEHFRNNPVSL
jgi:hypothetical protein